MDKELEQYYESYLDLFMTDGWKNFVEDFQLAAHELSNIRRVSTLEEMKFIQGKLEVIDNILNFETNIKNTFESYQDDT